MHPAVYRALEFDRIREALAREATTPLGRERALTIEPATDLDDVQGRLDLAAETLAFVRRDGRLSIDAPEDLGDVLAALDLIEDPLAPMQLVGLARFVDSVETVADAIRAADGESHQLLLSLVAPVQSFRRETAAIRRAIDPAGEVVDDASPALRDIRDQLRRQRGRLRATLEGMMRGRDTAKYLQDQIVTDRNGRYVIIVRAEHRDAIPGIVHGTSASGASLYVEPLSTVDLNNDIVALSEREKEEVRRILLALTNAFRQRAADLEILVTAAADVDEAHAKARLALRLDGVAPVLIEDGRVEFRGARHPLLILMPALKDRPASDRAPVVASDLAITPPTTALVISGPNTGGKTVALKAVGLLSLMAQSGMLIPVEPGSAMTPFASIFADIGDDQSIAASLSTFSARIANLVAIERDLQPPALVLLDEVGSGTDPVEGGALGAAVIEHLRRRGALVVATTHDDALKSYAATTDGVSAAAFGFDAETFAPSYRLVYGAPGRSLAIEIAKRLGMPADVIADARARQSGRESQLAAHLARVDQELAAAETERRRAADDRAALERERQAIREREARLAEREAVLRKRLDDKLNEKLREARAEVDAVVTRLKSKAATLEQQAESRVAARAPVLTTGEVGSLRAEARGALGAIGDALEPAGPEDDAQVLERPPAVGDKVFVVSLNTEGVVRGVSGKQIEVDIRGKRMRVALQALRKKAPGPGPHTPAHGQTPVAKGQRSGDLVGRTGARSTAAPTAAAEIVLIGSTVDNAIDRLEKFLDDALLGEERRLRVVHGHGTGRLREALRAHLREHAAVAHVSPAPENEGGDGATIVELKD